MSETRFRKGDRIGGRYLVYQALAGGMGEVYLCLDLERNYPFALKTFQRRYLGNQEMRRLFEEEVGTWVALEKHPNIVRCFYLDTVENVPFMFLAWVTGEEGRGADLRSWLRRGSLDLRLALDIMIDLCQGLMHAQEKQPGIVHRDLKPENVLVNQSRVAKITDFGLATFAQQAFLDPHEAGSEPTAWQGLTRVGGVVGTPAYMAPEQWRNEPVDARTDIYALGCILYELLTGQHAFQALTIEGLRRLHLDAARLRLVASLPAGLDGLVGRCLATRPDERPSSAAGLLEDLTRHYAGQFGAVPHPIKTGTAFTAADSSNRGATYAVLGRYEEALADFSRAIQLDPNDARAYSNRGNTYDKLHRYAEALADYDRAIQLDPTLAAVYANRGATHDRLQRYEEALADFSRAVELDPNDAKAYSNRGNTYDKLHRYAEALVDYDRAIQLDPTDAHAYTSRGASYGRLHRYKEALADLDRAIQLDPAVATASFNAGVLLYNQGHRRAALPYFEQAVQRGHSQAGRIVAQIRQELGGMQQAFEAFQRAQTLEELRGAVGRFPFMARVEFIVVVGQVMAQQVRPEHLPGFEQRLGWLRQIAAEEKGEG